MKNFNNLFNKPSSSVEIIIIILISITLGYWAGKEAFNNELQEKYSISFENAVIEECDGDGCHVSVPDFDTFYANCDKNHFCIREGKTALDKQNDINSEKEFEVMAERATSVYKSKLIK